MRFRLACLALSLAIIPAAFAKDVYLSIGGSVGSFATDARIFNPSQSKDIQISAYFLPVGNVDNSGVHPITITVAKRAQVYYNDVVASLFHGSGLGAIRLSSADDFVATQRIYANVSGDTLGQFVGGVDATNALKNGVVIQLKNNGGGSVVDNGSSDPTYVPASNDSDPPSASSTPSPAVFTVTLSSFHIDISPSPAGLRVGDQVQFKVSSTVAGLHGFRLTSPDGSQDLVPDRGPYPANQVFTYNFTIPTQGTYFYTCTNASCGTGHSNMEGTFDVGQASVDPPHY